MFACTMADGMAFAFPNPCKVPAGPITLVIPFPSIAMCMQATGACMTVMAMSSPVLVVGSKMPMSSGDEAGVGGGVVSGVNRGEVAYKQGSMKVKAGGKAIVRLTSPTAHNGSNANAPMGTQITPSQPKVLVLS